MAVTKKNISMSPNLFTTQNLNDLFSNYFLKTHLVFGINHQKKKRQHRISSSLIICTEIYECM